MMTLVTLFAIAIVLYLVFAPEPTTPRNGAIVHNDCGRPIENCHCFDDEKE